MGVTLKVFIVEDDDRLRRLPIHQFDGLRFNDKKTKPLPEYANRKVRYVLIGLDIENRIVSEIIHVDYSYFCFDKNGRFDQEFKMLEQRSVVETMALMISPKEKKAESNLIDAERIFHKKRREHEFRWSPTPEIEKSIVEAVFSEKKPVKPPLRLV